MPPRRASAAALAARALLLGSFAGCCAEVLRRRCDGDTPFKEALDLCQGKPLEQIECESVGCCVYDTEAGECSYRVAAALEETKEPPVDKPADAKPPAQRLIRREEHAAPAGQPEPAAPAARQPEPAAPAAQKQQQAAKKEGGEVDAKEEDGGRTGEQAQAALRLHEESMAEYKAEQSRADADSKKANVHPAVDPSQVTLQGWDGSVPTPWGDGGAPRPGADEPATSMAQVEAQASCQSCWTCAKPATQYEGRGYTCQCLSASMWQRVLVDAGSPRFTQVNEWCNGALPGNAACTHKQEDERCRDFGPGACSCDAEYRIEAWWSKTSDV